jgi:hypothetical protein
MECHLKNLRVSFNKNIISISLIEGDGAHRVIWTDERGFHHLAILNATPEDEGEYSVSLV